MGRECPFIFLVLECPGLSFPRPLAQSLCRTIQECTQLQPPPHARPLSYSSTLDDPNGGGSNSGGGAVTVGW